MNSIRAFFAIELNPQVKQQLTNLFDRFTKGNIRGVRWVKPQNIHLTLVFLGDTPPARIPQLQIGISRLISNYSPFLIEAAGLGAFPNRHHPRVIWVGLNAPPELATMQSTIQQFALQLGLPIEERPFSPHLTIGRVIRDASPEEMRTLVTAIETTYIGSLGSFSVTEITLFKSTLQSGGSFYTPLWKIPLSVAPDS